MNERADSFIDAAKSDMYRVLVDEPNSIFYKHNRTDVYVAAAALGFYKGRKAKIEGKKQGLFVSTTLGRGSENSIWILKSIGIAILGIDSLNDFRAVIAICDEYANYGIDELYHMHCDSSNEANEYASMMIDMLEEHGIN